MTPGDTTQAKVSLQTVDWGRAVVVSLAATILQILAELLMKESPFSFGAVLVRHASQSVQSLVGALGTFAIGQVYGLLYVIFLAPVKLWGRIIRALIASLAIDYLSILTMRGAPVVTWSNAWPRAVEFLVFTLTLSFLYRGKEPS